MQNIYQPTEETFLKARELLMNDNVVVFPTETIYGLGANALSDVGARRIFELKGRPNDNPLIVHLWEKSQISDYAVVENEIQQHIIDKLMPWPITLLLPKKEGISSVACNVPLVGIRLPSNTIAQQFLKTVGLPIVAPSANISGKPSPTNAMMVYDNLGEKVPMIIDGGESEAGIESTVVQVVPVEGGFKILILRPGFVTKGDLEKCFDWTIEVEYSQKNPELSPGMRYKHYSITGEVKIISEVDMSLLTEWKKIWFLVTQEFLEDNQEFFGMILEEVQIKIWGSYENLVSCAHSLFESYHSFEQDNINLLYVEQLPEVGIGYSIMNRVKRSAEIF